MPLDFLVIGAQKAGTTALHLLLKQHPHLALPAEKEAPFFNTDVRYRLGLERFVAEVFTSDDGAMRGKVTPHYMMGSPSVPVPLIAERVATALPQVRLVAVLRDPVDRAVSQWRMMVRRGQERRSFTEAVDDALGSEFEASRSAPTATNTYVAQGEYGRILDSWLRHVEASRLHVVLTADLERDPAGVLIQVHRFLGVDPLTPEDVGRVHVGGTGTRLPETEWRELYRVLDREVWPRAGDATRRAFDYWFQQWNVIPDQDSPVLDERTRGRLDELYAADADRLAKIGVDVPWAARPVVRPGG